MSQEEWLTVHDVAEILKVDTETVRRWIKRGTLSALDLGSRKTGYRIARADLDQFIAEHDAGRTLPKQSQMQGETEV